MAALRGGGAMNIAWGTLQARNRPAGQMSGALRPRPDERARQQACARALTSMGEPSAVELDLDRLGVEAPADDRREANHECKCGEAPEVPTEHVTGPVGAHNHAAPAGEEDDADGSAADEGDELRADE